MKPYALPVVGLILALSIFLHGQQDPSATTKPEDETFQGFMTELQRVSEASERANEEAHKKHDDARARLRDEEVQAETRAYTIPKIAIIKKTHDDLKQELDTARKSSKSSVVLEISQRYVKAKRDLDASVAEAVKRDEDVIRAHSEVAAAQNAKDLALIDLNAAKEKVSELRRLLYVARDFIERRRAVEQLSVGLLSCTDEPAKVIRITGDRECVAYYPRSGKTVVIRGFDTRKLAEDSEVRTDLFPVFVSGTKSIEARRTLLVFDRIESTDTLSKGQLEALLQQMEIEQKVRESLQH